MVELRTEDKSVERGSADDQLPEETETVVMLKEWHLNNFDFECLSEEEKSANSIWYKPGDEMPLEIARYYAQWEQPKTQMAFLDSDGQRIDEPSDEEQRYQWDGLKIWTRRQAGLE